MARKLRIQFEDAVYHVISRGNYRAHVFAAERTKGAFLTCLDEACRKAGWVVHAWCVMSNHYHLCLQTPQPNLVEGMRWLQGTFSVRFNRLRDERGHLFQGRYKALLVAPEAVGPVCHYIHLNPVRARLSTVAELPHGRWTSLKAYSAPRERPAWLSVATALTDAGGLADTPAGRRSYLQYLAWLQEDEQAKRELAFERMTKDWAIGSRAFRKDLIKEHAALESDRRIRAEAGQLAQELWTARLQSYLAAVSKSANDVQSEPKGASWKVAIAAAMKAKTTAPNPWLAGQLNMGSPFRLSRLVTASRVNPSAFRQWAGAIAKCKI